MLGCNKIGRTLKIRASCDLKTINIKISKKIKQSQNCEAIPSSYPGLNPAPLVLVQVALEPAWTISDKGKSDPQRRTRGRKT